MTAKAALWVALLLCFPLGAGVASGKQWEFSGSVRIRAEQWNFFDPGVARVDKDYHFVGSLTRMAASRNLNEKISGAIEVIHTGFWGLPSGAVRPAPIGDLGFGGSYRRFAGGRDGALNLRQLFVRSRFSNSQSFMIGRWDFGEGLEGMPQNPDLSWIRRVRIAERLIGPFGFSHIQRGFDGVRWLDERKEKAFAFVLARPTRGAFDIKASDHLSKVTFGYGSAGFHPSSDTDSRIFAIWYRDERQPPSVVKVDNRPVAARVADARPIQLSTIGGHFVKLWKNGDGQWDSLAWGCYQFGNWGSLSHRAHALALEGGFRWTTEKGKPWLRIGYFEGSGDFNPGDSVHQTFFQILPTARQYARTPVFNMMNNRDLFVQFLYQPTDRLSLRMDFHRLYLHRSEDLWYAGPGAINNSSFGFSGRPSGRRSQLMDLLDLSLDYRQDSHTTWSLYLGRVIGRGVVQATFPVRSSGHFLYLEWLWRW